MLVKDKKKLKEAAFKFGGAMRDIAVAAASHPATAGIFCMFTSSVLKMLLTQNRDDTEWRRRINKEQSGLYDGIQKLALAAAAVPAVVGGLNLLQTAVERKKG